MLGSMRTSSSAPELLPSTRMEIAEGGEDEDEVEEQAVEDEGRAIRATAGPAELLPMILQIFRDRHQTGSTNDALVDHMVSAGSVTESRIEAAFRAIDRASFIPDAEGASGAYDDSPIRSGHFHMSQPSLYADALAALQLEQGNSFLNVGAGTGYLSSIVSEITGEALHHGVDLHEDVLDHAKAMVKKQGKNYIKLFQVNVHDIDIEKSPRYQRIYLGACAGGESKHLLNLLEVGGILVGPFSTSTGQYIRRVVRKSATAFEVKNLKSVQFSPLVRSDSPNDEKFVLPLPVWTPETHTMYSKAFRKTLVEVLFCTTREESPLHIVPREILVDHVFGFIHPRWFDDPSEGPYKEVLEDGGEREMGNEGDLDEVMRLRTLQTLRTVASLANLGNRPRPRGQERLNLDEFMLHLLSRHPEEASEEDSEDGTQDAQMNTDEPMHEAGDADDAGGSTTPGGEARDSDSDMSGVVNETEEDGERQPPPEEVLTPDNRGARELAPAANVSRRRAIMSRGCQVQ